jgi:hypothetical protein
MPEETFIKAAARGGFSQIGNVIRTAPHVDSRESAAEQDFSFDVLQLISQYVFIDQLKLATPLRAITALLKILLPKLLTWRLSAANPLIRLEITQ